jgi:spermidine/putrescine transport system permease protein
MSVTTTTMPAVRSASPPAKARKPRRSRTRFGDKMLHSYTWLVIIWLMAPIAIMILFSFNNTTGRINTTWNGFTLKWYSPSKLGEYNDLLAAVKASLIIVVFAVIGSTLLGTLVGLALGKYRFRGQGSLNLVLFATISAPEIVMGASLLSFFVQLGVPLGTTTIIIAHIMFSLSFVAVIVRARVLTLDPSIEEAAKDLGASALTTFRRVTLPMIFPAVISGALLAFVLSIDDFVVTTFTAGSVVTFPLWIYGSSKLGMPPQVNVIGTLIFVAGLLIAAINLIAARRERVR